MNREGWFGSDPELPDMSSYGDRGYGYPEPEDDEDRAEWVPRPVAGEPFEWVNLTDEAFYHSEAVDKMFISQIVYDGYIRRGQFDVAEEYRQNLAMIIIVSHVVWDVADALELLWYACHHNEVVFSELLEAALEDYRSEPK